VKESSNMKSQYHYCLKEINKMKINTGYIIVGLIIAFTMFFELAAHADEIDHATKITFRQPVQVPGQVLPAGSYLFLLTDTESTEHVVQILSSDRSVLYGTFLTSAAELQEPAGDTEFTFAEPESGGVPVLLKWFYPGQNTGNEFVYSKQAEKELAQDRLQTVVVNQARMSYSGTAGAGN
jgi:hypothetical protein